MLPSHQNAGQCQSKKCFSGTCQASWRDWSRRVIISPAGLIAYGRRVVREGILEPCLLWDSLEIPASNYMRTVENFLCVSRRAHIGETEEKLNPATTAGHQFLDSSERQEKERLTETLQKFVSLFLKNFGLEASVRSNLSFWVLIIRFLLLNFKPTLQHLAFWC